RIVLWDNRPAVRVSLQVAPMPARHLQNYRAGSGLPPAGRGGQIARSPVSTGQHRRRGQLYRTIYPEYSGDGPTQRNQIRPPVLFTGGSYQLKRPGTIQSAVERFLSATTAGRCCQTRAAHRVVWIWDRRPHSPLSIADVRVHTAGRLQT